MALCFPTVYVQFLRNVYTSAFTKQKVIIPHNFELLIVCRFCNTSNYVKNGHNNLEKESGSKEDPSFPEEPTNCCMSGCANCVWITYAEELTKQFNDGGQKAKDTILEKITDPSMKMFLLMELKSLENEKAKS